MPQVIKSVKRGYNINRGSRWMRCTSKNRKPTLRKSLMYSLIAKYLIIIDPSSILNQNTSPIAGHPAHTYGIVLMSSIIKYLYEFHSIFALGFSFHFLFCMSLRSFMHCMSGVLCVSFVSSFNLFGTSTSKPDIANTFSLGLKAMQYAWMVDRQLITNN